jgi:hypothetical protein
MNNPRRPGWKYWRRLYVFIAYDPISLLRRIMYPLKMEERWLVRANEICHYFVLGADVIEQLFFAEEQAGSCFVNDR